MKSRIERIKVDIYALYLAYKRPDTPWYAKVVAAIVVGYALSPRDLIPDFIPVIGYLDDVIIVPLGMMVSIKLIPETILEDCRWQARERLSERSLSRNWIAGIVIISIWVILVTLFLGILYKVFRH